MRRLHMAECKVVAQNAATYSSFKWIYVCALGCALHRTRIFGFSVENVCRRLNDDSDMSIAFTLVGTVTFECTTKWN